MTTDATTVFLRDGDFKESAKITYHPHTYYGTVARADREIDAVIEREAVQTIAEDGAEHSAPLYIVHVANSSTLGISSDELDVGGDQLTFAGRENKTPRKRSIVQVITQDHAMLILQVR